MPITRVPGALQQLLGAGLMAEAVEAWEEAAGGSPRLLVASGTEMWGAFEVPTTQVEAPASGPERKSFVFTQRGKFLRTLVFPLKQTSEKLFSEDQDQLFSISVRGWERRAGLAGRQHERRKLDRR